MKHSFLMEINCATPRLDPDSAPPSVFADAAPDGVRACRILIIDDEETNVRLLERLLVQGGYHNFVSTTDSGEATALFDDFQPDIVLTDWLMPVVDGYAVIGQLRALVATNEYLPIVVLTADCTAQTRQRALAAGATDFLTKPFEQIEVLLRIQNLLTARLSHLVVQAQNTRLEESVRQRTMELERALVELQRTQKQVIRNERLAALGAMAGGVAHDFNNALSIITGFGELLRRDAERGLAKENATPSIDCILNAAEDASRIVQRLRAFHRPEEAEEYRIPVNLNTLIEQAASLSQPRLAEVSAGGRTITMTTEPGEIPCITGDPAELREALINLIFNAMDALPEGGAITLSTGVEDEVVVLKIIDNGSGMTEEVQQRCLEPFFTTKGDRGTGLGLAMVFGILQRHGGDIEIQTAPGQGTTFALRLPMPIPALSALHPKTSLPAKTDPRLE